MKVIYFSWVIGLFLCISSCQNRKLLADSIPSSRQLVLVLSPDENSTSAILRRFEKKDAKWEQVGTAHPVMLGRSGLAPGTGIHDPQLLSAKPKREGDGKSPAGIFRFGTAFGYAKEATFKLPYLHSGEAIECVDDSGSGFYNQLVDNALMTKDWLSSEFMRRKDEQYRWGIVVNHNTPAKPMGGSCIFFHIWKAPGEATSGCTAMSEENLLDLMNWLDPKDAPLLVQLTGKDYAVFQKKYKLPTLQF